MRLPAAALAVALLAPLASPLPAVSAPDRAEHFDPPIDAVSFRMPGADRDLDVSYRGPDGSWSEWQTLGVEDEQDPSLTETQLFMFPASVSDVRVRGDDQGHETHPIRVAKGPAKVEVASAGAAAKPKILSRSQWGADDSILFETGSASSESTDTAAGDNGANATSSQRVKDCVDAQKNYPDEFKVQSTVKTDASGRAYRWPLSYSKEIHLLVVHHTALYVSDDDRDPAERMRALYQYHAQNRGWGDVGYNYVVDEKGQIYEGRQGGRNVVAGHAYCNNVGTVGISMMGNFDLEQPTQVQVQALQWLLKELSDEYGLDPNKAVTFHGKHFVSPYVGHRDLVSTDCPGYYMYGALGQVIANVRSGNVSGTVKFPVTATKSSSSKSSSAPPVARGITKAVEGLSAVGRTGLSMAPGAKQRIMLTYVAPATGVHANGRIAQVALSSQDIVIVQEDGSQQIPVKTSLSSQYDVPGGEELSISLLVQAPWNAGNYWFEIGGIKYTLTAAGRRSRVDSYANPFAGTPSASSSSSAPVVRRVRPAITVPVPSSRSSSSSRASSAPPFAGLENASAVRIRLSASESPSVWFENGGTAAGKRVAAGDKVRLSASGNSCRAQATGIDAVSSAIAMAPAAGIATVDSVNGKVRRYRGTIECRVIDGQVTLINQVNLEDYLRGMSEEPDTEPYQKQRAFAVAARSYVAYWMQPSNRKFPGMPYDGTDSPATFQAYSGYDVETANPQWAKAVDSTNGQVLTYNNQLVRAPYFSSDDGTTRTPEQAGWNNFPFSQQLFRAKADPWCEGMPMAGHGVGMSGCGAEGQANEGKTAEQILQYYYPGAVLRALQDAAR